MKLLACTLVAFGMSAAAYFAAPTDTVEICFGPSRPCYVVDLADDEEERARGLMGVASLADDQGMLFDFGSPVRAGFWMKNTLIPLRAVWIDESAHVVGSTVMTPCPADVADCPIYDAPAPVRWVLEISDTAPAPAIGDMMRVR